MRRLFRAFLGSLYGFFLTRRPIDPGPSVLTSRYTYHPYVTAAHWLPSAYLLLEDVSVINSQVLEKTWAVQ
jgi:hypothetical protein